jgi:Galactose oxidase, central domain
MTTLTTRRSFLMGLALAACTPAAKPTPRPNTNLLVPLTMTERRAAHTATLLSNGRVLLAGGFQDKAGGEVAFDHAELFDPVSNTFAPIRNLTEPRNGHTATLLPSGLVLLAGGWGLRERLDTNDVFDPQTGQFTSIRRMAQPRAGHTATLLKNGSVLIAGGKSARDHLVVAAELYDAATGHFQLGSTLLEGRENHTATLLPDDRVLIVGGGDGQGRVLASAELYDLSTNQFTRAGSMSVPRYKHAAALLAGGSVLVIGGSDGQDWQGQYATAEIFDVATRVFMPAADLLGKRFKLADAITTLDTGDVLIGGGNAVLERFDATRKVFTRMGNLGEGYFYATLTQLNDGRVLIAGGYNRAIKTTAKAWLFQSAG